MNEEQAVKIIIINKKAVEGARLIQEVREALDEAGLYEESIEVSKCLIRLARTFKETLIKAGKVKFPKGGPANE